MSLKTTKRVNAQSRCRTANLMDPGKNKIGRKN